MPRFALLSVLAATLAGTTPLDAQRADTVATATRTGRRTALPVEQEIALARSGAPASISANAQVLMLTDTGHVVVARGTSGVTCVVNRSWNRSLEPVCYDPEASATILQIELRRELLLHQGKSEAEADADVGKALLDGRLRLPTRPALSYMMSAGQVLYDDTGRFVGQWRPHLMLYYPYLTNAALGLPARPELSVGMVMEDGRHNSFLMIMMPTFVDVATTSAARP